jgi:hypothetical protein
MPLGFIRCPCLAAAVIIRGCCRLAASDSRRRVYHRSYCLRLNMFEVRTPRDVHNEIWNGPPPSLLEGLFTWGIIILVIIIALCG